MYSKRIKGLCCAIVAAMSLSVTPMVSARTVLKDAGFEVRTNVDGVEIGAPTYKVGAESITSLAGQGNKDVEVSAKAKSASGAKDVLMIVALYDGDNRIVTTSMSQTSKIATTETALNASIKMPEDVTASYKLKTFIWDTKDNVAPYAQYFDLENKITSNWTLGEKWYIKNNATQAPLNGYGCLFSNSYVTDTPSYASQTVSVKPDEAYKLSFDYRGQKYGVQVLGQDKKTILAQEEALINNSSYTSANSFLAFNTGDNTEITVRFVKHATAVAAGEGDFYVDNVMLSRNLLTNPYFEGPVEATLWSGNGSRAYETTNVFSGSGAMSIDRGTISNAHRDMYVTDELKAAGAGTYMLAGRLKTENSGTARVCLEVQFNDSRGTKTFEVHGEVGSGWQNPANTEGDVANQGSTALADKSISFTDDDIAHISSARFFIWAGGSELSGGGYGKLYADDLVLMKVASDNLVKNPDFENLTTKTWSTSTGTLAVDENNAHTGVASLCYTRNGASGITANSGLKAKLNELGAGTYKLSVWVKMGDAGWPSITYKYYTSSDVAKTNQQYGLNDKIGEWQEISMEIEIPKADFGESGTNSLKGFDIVIAGGTPKIDGVTQPWMPMYIDDIKLEKLPD